MPTPSEQKALAFVAIVILLGGAVRVLRAGSTSAPSQQEQQGIARQARAADSAAHVQAAKPKGKGRKPRGADTLATVIGGVTSVPPTFARPDQPYAKSPYGFPPPSPRIDIDAHRGAFAPQAGPPASGGQQLLDLDHATADQIEKLPYIGATLARRIVANRDSLGPFGTVKNLGRVKGIGPKLLEKLTPLVTVVVRDR